METTETRDALEYVVVSLIVGLGILAFERFLDLRYPVKRYDTPPVVVNNYIPIYEDEEDDDNISAWNAHY